MGSIKEQFGILTLVKQCLCCVVLNRCVLFFSGIVKWLWSRCRRWRRPSRPWSTFTTTTWEATNTWESPSPSPPFKNLTYKLLTAPGQGLLSEPFETVSGHLGGGTTLIESVLLLGFCWSCHSLRDWNLWLASFFKENNCRYWILPAINCTSVFLCQANYWHDWLSPCMIVWCRSVFNSWFSWKDTVNVPYLTISTVSTAGHVH